MQKTSPVLFENYKLGPVTLKNRFVMASLTRMRCNPENGIPNDLLVEYYSQRASAGLILSECAAISERGNTFPGCGGIYNKEQVKGWKRVTDAVHQKGSKIFIQIWHGGRSAAANKNTGEPPLAPSAIVIKEDRRKGVPHDVPKEMTHEDIKEVIEQFRQGALNAKEAGFDGIELHGAHGYLVDEFLRDGANKRTDEYGGSVENRSRFCLEIIDILIEIFGADRVGIKLSPVNKYQSMSDSDPVTLYTYLLQQLDKRGIAYIQIREMEDSAKTGDEDKKLLELCKTLRPFFKGTIMINENLTPEKLTEAIENGYADLGVFGKPFISNPDFVERVQNGWPLNAWDFSTFFYGGNEKGYTDYPFYEKNKELTH